MVMAAVMGRIPRQVLHAPETLSFQQAIEGMRRGGGGGNSQNTERDIIKQVLTRSF